MRQTDKNRKENLMEFVTQLNEKRSTFFFTHLYLFVNESL